MPVESGAQSAAKKTQANDSAPQPGGLKFSGEARFGYTDADGFSDCPYADASGKTEIVGQLEDFYLSTSV